MAVTAFNDYTIQNYSLKINYTRVKIIFTLSLLLQFKKKSIFQKHINK